MEGKAVVGKVNVDENTEVPVEYNIRGIPALLIFKNGEVVDKVTGKDAHTIESYVHFHPDFSLHINDDNNVILKCHEDDFAVLSIDSHCHGRIEKTIYCPEFGLKQPIECLVISRFGAFPSELSYRLQRL